MSTRTSAILRALSAAALARATAGAVPHAAPPGEPRAGGARGEAAVATPGGRVVRVESAVFPRELVTFRVLDWPFGGPKGETVLRSLQAGVLAAVDGGFVVNGRPDDAVESIPEYVRPRTVLTVVLRAGVRTP